MKPRKQCSDAEGVFKSQRKPASIRAPDVVRSTPWPGRTLQRVLPHVRGPLPLAPFDRRGLPAGAHGCAAVPAAMLPACPKSAGRVQLAWAWAHDGAS
jgi:hypothetical protein